MYVISTSNSNKNDTDVIRPELAEMIERYSHGLDKNRPDVVEKRKKTNQRTARANVEDLCDPGSFVEYGAFAIAAQRGRRSEEDLRARTPADGIITGIGAINGAEFGPDQSRCVILAYDYSVLAGTQGYFNHRKKDRMLRIAHEERLPLILFAEGGGGRPCV